MVYDKAALPESLKQNHNTLAITQVAFEHARPAAEWSVKNIDSITRFQCAFFKSNTAAGVHAFPDAVDDRVLHWPGLLSRPNNPCNAATIGHSAQRLLGSEPCEEVSREKWSFYSPAFTAPATNGLLHPRIKRLNI